MQTFLQFVIEKLAGPPARGTGQAGESYWCCPFHADRNPSFHTMPQRAGFKDRFMCFGCATRGDEADFLAGFFPGEPWPVRQRRLVRLWDEYRELPGACRLTKEAPFPMPGEPDPASPSSSHSSSHSGDGDHDPHECELIAFGRMRTHNGDRNMNMNREFLRKVARRAWRNSAILARTPAEIEAIADPVDRLTQAVPELTAAAERIAWKWGIDVRTLLEAAISQEEI